MTSIGTSAFSGCSGLTSITLPSSLTSIGSNAFYSCYALAETYNYSPSIIVEKGMTSNGYVGYYAKIVYNASELSGNKPISKIQTIGSIKYYIDGEDFIALAPAVARDSLTSLILDSKTTGINQYAFNGCNGLTEIDLSNCINLTSIGSNAFYNCIELTSIDLPTSLISIEDYAFSGCSGLTKVVIPEGVNSIGESAFYGCSGLISITLPSTLISIGRNSFWGCGDLEEINYNVKSLEDLAYNDCAFYNAGQNGQGIIVNFGDSVETIPANLFKVYYNSRYYPPKIVEINFSSKIVSIGESAFSYCDNIETIIYEGTIDKWLSIDFGSGWMYDVSHEFIVNGEELTNLIVPEGVTSIGTSAFHGCSGLKSIILPSSLTNIEKNAFSSCSGLVSVDFSKCTSLMSIGSYAFSNCDGLAGIDLSSCKKLNFLGNYAFNDCDILKNITFPNTSGWYRTTSSTATSGTRMTMTNSAQNARWLTSDNSYARYYFKRNA